MAVTEGYIILTALSVCIICWLQMTYDVPNLASITQTRARPCTGAAVKSACLEGGGPRVVVSTAAFHARVRGSVPGLGGLRERKNVSSPSTCESQYCMEPP